MPEIRPFPGYVYDAAVAGPIDRNLAEPYDKVTDAKREAYLAGSERNVVRVDLPREEEGGLDRYATAARRLRGWMAEGVLRRATGPAFYLYDQGYEWEGVQRTRRSFYALVEAREYQEGAVLPHERTFPEPKADRLAHLKATRANLAAVFLLYRQPNRQALVALEAAAEHERPLVDAALPDGTTHRLTAVTDPQALAACREAVREVTCVIADGHHRYETSLGFRREQEDLSDMLPGYRYVLASLVEATDPGLLVLPTHRLLPPGLTASQVAERAGRAFDVERLEGDAPAVALAREALQRTRGRPTFVAIDGDGAYRLSLRTEALLDDALASVPSAVRGLDVALLHAILLERGLGLPPTHKEKTVGYARTAAEALEAVASGRHGSAVLLNPVAPATVIEVARARATMPQKSTDFYPKMLSGLVVADLTDIG